MPRITKKSKRTYKKSKKGGTRFNNVIKEHKKKWNPLLDMQDEHYSVFNNMGRYFLNIYNFLLSSSYFKIMEPSK